jgi:branched-chain amino acid transport system substrate-binding protein
MEKRKKVLGFFLAIAFLLAAFGAQAQEIKIGGAQPVTGRFSFAGIHINAGLEDYIKYTNERGGINGKSIKYIMEDTEYIVEKAVAVFKRIMAKDNPVIMYGDSTGLSKAIAPLLNTQYKVLYGSTSFSSELSDPQNNPYTFVSGPTYSDMFGILLKYISQNPKERGRKPRVAFFYSDTEFGKDPIPFGKTEAQRLGIEVVAEVVAAVGAVEVTSQVIELRRAKPDYVIFQGYTGQPCAVAMKTARDMGLNITFMGTIWGMDRTMIELAGPAAEAYMGVTPYSYYWQTEVPMIQEIIAFNQKHHPDIQYRPTYYMQSWFTGMIFVECLKRADKMGKINGDNLVKALHSLKDFDTGGLTPPVTFKNNKSPAGRVYKADVAKKIYTPISDWIRMD